MFDLERFVESAQDASKQSGSQAAIRELLTQALDRPRDVLQALGEPHTSGFEVVLHTPTLTILNMVWRPQMVLFPHNHEMWTVVGIYTGREDNIFWRKRNDDTDGRIEAAGAKALAEGEATSLGHDVIHSVTNPIPRFTGALHIYGGDFFADGRSQWDAETLRQEPLNMQGLRDRFAG